MPYSQTMCVAGMPSRSVMSDEVPASARTGAALVAAGFHHTRAGRQFEAQILFRKKIQQMHKRESRAEQNHGPL